MESGQIIVATSHDRWDPPNGGLFSKGNGTPYYFHGNRVVGEIVCFHLARSFHVVNQGFVAVPWQKPQRFCGSMVNASGSQMALHLGISLGVTTERRKL